MTSKRTLPPTRMATHHWHVSLASSITSLLLPSVRGHGPLALCHRDRFLGTPTAGRSVINCRCYYCPRLLWSLSLHCQVTATFYLRDSDSSSVHPPPNVNSLGQLGLWADTTSFLFSSNHFGIFWHISFSSVFKLIVTNNTVHRKPMDSYRLSERPQELLT